MEVFPVVKSKDEQRHENYRTKWGTLELYDGMQQTMASGEANQALVSPPTDASVVYTP